MKRCHYRTVTLEYCFVMNKPVTDEQADEALKRELFGFRQNEQTHVSACARTIRKIVKNSC